ncbi:MAG: phosphoribosylamine--glycine ligase [Firmicutes bacterium]|nr:phosphoribosylamine--glycine ligase [Bacillota bacterium]
MRVLLVGSGGREHALAWGISRSPLLSKLYAAPGNPGIATVATCLDTAANDIAGLVQAAVDNNIDLVVVGPEEPLALGLVDALQVAGIAAFGPTQAAAQLESSKAWAKEFMQKYNIPTAAYRTFTDFATALAHVQSCKYPVVIKASGLAAGKGAIIASDLSEAESTLRSMLVDNQYGTAGSEVVIEEYLCGPEVTLLALVAGGDYLVLPAAQDHKQIYDGDQGPNTGGMGAYSPVPAFTDELQQEAINRILLPTLRGLKQEGIHYQGVLYLGLMLTKQGPQVIEYNVRFGDPETQVVLPRIESDVLALLAACANGNLRDMELTISPQPCATVIMAAPGYPGSYPKGLPIQDLELAEAESCLVFQAGTRWQAGRLQSAGGRILAVSALGGTLPAALERAYAGVAKIKIPGAHYRRDIGYRIYDV